jgi:hypothetical protein
MRFGNKESSVPFRERLAMISFKSDQLLPGVEKKKWVDVKEDYLAEADDLLEHGGEESARNVMQDALHKIAAAWGMNVSAEEQIPWQIAYLDPTRKLTPAEEAWALELERELREKGRIE